MFFFFTITLPCLGSSLFFEHLQTVGPVFSPLTWAWFSFRLRLTRLSDSHKQRSRQGHQILLITRQTSPKQLWHFSLPFDSLSDSIIIEK